MNLKERVMEACKNKYECLESNEIEGIKIITVGTEEEPYVLNFEIGDATISVNVIDKSKGSVIDDYEDSYEGESFDEKITNAVETYENIVKNKDVIRRVQENRAQKEKFDAILADGSPCLFGALSKEELHCLNKYIDENVEDGVAKKLAHYAVNVALNNLDAKKRETESKTEFHWKDKVTVSGGDKVGTLVDYLTSDPMDSFVGCDSGDFGAWVVEYDDGTTEMVDEKYLTLVEPAPQESESLHYIEEGNNDSHVVNEDVNTLSSRVDIQCSDEVVIVAEITACEDEHYQADYIAGLSEGDKIGFVLDDKHQKDATISKMYHGIITIKISEEDKSVEYRVDSKHCDIDFSEKIIKFNAVKSNDIAGDWYAFLKLSGSMETLKNEVKTALTESVSSIENSGAEGDNEVENIISGPEPDSSEILKSAGVMNLLHAVAENLADLNAQEEDELQKAILSDISSQVEQIISELYFLNEDEQ